MANDLYNDQVSHNGTEPAPAKPAERAVVRPGELMDLGPNERKKLRKACKDVVDTWVDNTGEHRDNLKRWNDLYEGVIEETDWPWEGASNLHIPLAALHLNTLHSVICRSMFTVSPLWFGRSLDPEAREVIPAAEDMLDYKAKSELNTVDAGRQAVLTAGRDSIGWTKTYWAEIYEHVSDIVIVENEVEFTKEFPDGESAGMTDEEYQETIARVRTEASPENPMEIPVELDRLVYKGPKTDVVEEADMIRAPVTAQELSDCWAYGHLFYERKADLKRKAKDGQLWQDQVERLCKSKNNGSDKDDWRKAKDDIEGVSDGDSKRSGRLPLYEIVVKCDLYDKGYEEKYICTYSKDADILLGVVKHGKTEMYIPWRYLKRPGRMLGISIIGMLENLNAEADASIQQEINSSMIDSVPVFVGKKGAKADMDEAGLFADFFRPGNAAFLENPGDFKALEVPKKDNRDSQARRQELMRYAEMLVGPTQMLSGRESPIDPEAPGNKTIALIQQSNMRIEDYINELRQSFDRLGEIHLSLYYERGPNVIEYETDRVSEEEAEQFVKAKRIVKELQRKNLRGNIKLSTHGVTATANPEIEFSKALKWWEILSKEPMVGGDKARRRELLNRLMLAGRLEGREDLLPPKEEVEAIMEAEREQAIRQKVLSELVAKGLLPPPVPGLAPPAAAPGLPPALPMPGAPSGAPGLPPISNLPGGPA